MKKQRNDIEKTRIYLVSNCYNDPNKVYIGKEKSHKNDTREKSHKKTFGSDIIFTYIDECDGWNKGNWKPLECYWIEQFRQWGFELMNKNKGGGGPSFQKEESKNKISNSLKGIERTQEFKNNVSKGNKGKPKPIGFGDKKPKPIGFGDKLRSKKRTQEIKDKISKGKIKNKYNGILQYDIDGNFVKEWNNINEIFKILKINNISASCSGRQETAGGFIWKYKFNSQYELKIPPSKYKNIPLPFTKRKIIQYDLDKNQIREWDSIKEAKKYYKGDIWACCNKKQKTSSGFI